MSTALMKFHSKKKQALPHKDVKLVEIYQYHTDSSVHLLRVKYARVEEKKTKQNKTGPDTVPRKNLAGRQVCLAFRIPLSDRLEGIRNEIENGDCLSSETVTC